MVVAVECRLRRKKGISGMIVLTPEVTVMVVGKDVLDQGSGSDGGDRFTKLRRRIKRSGSDGLTWSTGVGNMRATYNGQNLVACRRKNPREGCRAV